MCEAHAFIITDGREEKLLDNVDLLEMEGNEIKLINIFGEQKSIKARFKLYDNSKRRIVLEAL